MKKVYMNDEAFINKGFTISTDNNLLDLGLIHNYLDKDSYWANGIPFDKLERSIKNSLCFGVYFEGKQIGFARVVTDKATFGYLADVFILPEFRKQGLSKWLVQTIMNHPDLQGLRRWSLATVDAHGLYAQFGFTEITNPERWMQIFTPHKVAEN
nr:GNAT family N-acetyltransferase [uncultured Mucilaginibacter sp.]